MPDDLPPRITIGLPVYNGETTIARAIQSLLGQTRKDFQLVISDNASTDSTAEICHRYADADRRVTYVRQARNLGAEANFDFVLQQADSDYFMWAAADDVRSADYLALCADFLDSHSDYVAATCPVRYEDGTPDPHRMGDATLDSDDLNANIVNVFDRTGRLRVNGRVYALFRRKALAFWLTYPDHYLGADWYLTVGALKQGKFKRLDNGYLELGVRGVSKGLTIFRIYRSTPLHWIVPFATLSRETLHAVSDATFAQRLSLWFRFARLNWRIARRQLRYEILLSFRRQR